MSLQSVSTNILLNSSVGSCPGTLYTRTCSLLPAIVVYFTIISNSSLALNPPTLATDSDLPTYSTITYIHITSNINAQRSTLGSLQFAGINAFGSNATQNYTQGAGRNIAYNGLLAFQSIRLDSYSYNELNQCCDVTSSDPTVSIPTHINNIMLRTALTAGDRNAAGAQNVVGT